MMPGDLLRWYGDDVFMYLGRFLWSDACVVMALGASNLHDGLREVVLYFHHERGIMWSEVNDAVKHKLLSAID